MSGDDFLDSIDYLGADRFSALGAQPVIIVDAATWRSPRAEIHAVVLGVDRAGALPRVAPQDFDLLLTTAVNAPQPWVSVSAERLDDHAAALAQSVHANPVAATMASSVLRINGTLDFHAGLKIESFAYSTLLAGGEFARWRQNIPATPVAILDGPLLRADRDGDDVTLTLNHPEAQNAMSAAMRDALHAALANLLDDPTEPSLLLRGTGKCFSTGGALGEFGTASDLAQAHIIRSVRSSAALLHRLGARATVHLHGACVGSGLEIPAAAAHRCATADAWFQLPELKMGLIPGAGGTVTVRRAIGRHRTLWMLLSGKRIGARQALDWGLIHEITP